jgi:butyrate kinase
MRILAINPGSTSTKISVYDELSKLFETTIRHNTDEIQKYKNILDQYDWRKEIIVQTLKDNNIDIKSLNAVVGRGGLLNPIEGGTYSVNEKMFADLRASVGGEHASNLGAFIAKSIADDVNIPSFIVDPKYEDLNLIVVHMGGGISIGAHRKGRVIDVVNAIDGEGPFSPERSGAVPVRYIIDMCFSGEFTHQQMLKKNAGAGGMVSYIGSNNLLEICNKAYSGDAEAKLLIDAMCYQIAKEIGSMATVLCGKVDAIVLTGGVANDKKIVAAITERVQFIASVHVYAGEEEMFALTQGCLAALKDKSIIKEYK